MSLKPLHLPSSLRDESGQSLVEFALALPIVLLIVMALVDFGRGISLWLDATHLASDGARLAAVNAAPPSGTLSQYILTQAPGNLQSGDSGSAGLQGPAKVCITLPSGSSRGEPVTVKVTGSYNWIPGGFIPGTFSIVGSSTMRLEQDATNFTSGECSS